jgi:transketolase
MAALMRLRNIFVYTHDSIGLGEDGPTHQPIEQAASLRLIPNLDVWRPADAAETQIAWRAAIERRDGPTALLLSRQNLAPLVNEHHLDLVTRGGYVLVEPAAAPTLLLLASGSEVALAVAAARHLQSGGEQVRVVSMPCHEVFDRQPAVYREQVLPAAIRRRIAIEAGVSAAWYRYTGTHGHVIGIDRFGESAPAADLFREFGLTEDAVQQSISEYLTSK